MRKILIVVDMQNDFVTGALGTPEARAIVPNIVEKIKEYNEYELGALDANIIFTFDTHDLNYPHTLEGQLLPVPHCLGKTRGHDLIPELEELLMCEKGEIYPLAEINKQTFGYEHWKAIIDAVIFANRVYQKDEELEIELCGVCTDICVISNALALRMFYPNTKIIVDASCCAGVTPEKHAAALEVMKSCQIEVINE